MPKNNYFVSVALSGGMFEVLKVLWIVKRQYKIQTYLSEMELNIC